jgi:abequosyltransferase
MTENSVTQPLLTLAMPTYNRASFLREMLEVLLPQLNELAAAGRAGDVELLVSDNAATDNTPEITAWLAAELQGSGIRLRVVRQPENIGPDRNFVYCFRQAEGRYFWLFGDDDIIRPGSLRVILDALRGGDYDLVFLTPSAFYSDWRKEFVPDPWGREAQVVHTARQMALTINVGITFISGYIVNREQLLRLPIEAPEAFVGTNLVQLSWALPLLRYHRQSLILWQRFVAGRALNSGGYNIADIFGENFLRVVKRLLPDRPRIASIFPNFALRQWFPASIIEQRALPDSRLSIEGTQEKLQALFAGNLRYWLFTWPVLKLSPRAAAVWFRLLTPLNRAIEWMQVPSDSLSRLRRLPQRWKGNT